MGPLANQRHERFAQALAEGKTAAEAYVLAGYKANDGNASRLKGNERISARVQEIVGRAAERAEELSGPPGSKCSPLRWHECVKSGACAGTIEGRPPDASIQNVSGLSQRLAGRAAAGWRRRGDGAGNKWRYERVCSPDRIALSGGLPWLSPAT